MTRRLLLALALLGAAPVVAPAQATDEITIYAGTWPKPYYQYPYFYWRYANGWQDGYMPATSATPTIWIYLGPSRWY